MGQLLSLANFGNSYDDVELNFEGNPSPSEADAKVYAEVAEVLSKTKEIFGMIENYKGCQDLARKAMSTPTHENEQAAFEGLLTVVDSISAFFQFCQKLESIFPQLLIAIANDTNVQLGPKQKGLVIPDAMALQLAQIMEFALEFDRVRMMQPNLSNDFSYYRRLLPKFNKHPDIRIKDDEASGMALFTAEHIPMMNCLSKAAARAQEKNMYVGKILSVMANSCNKALKTKKFAADQEMTMTVARAMTASIVIFDHIDTLSVFHKKSPVHVKSCVLTLKKDFPKDFPLLNAIRYSTKHFQEAPQSIQDLFD